MTAALHSEHLVGCGRLLPLSCWDRWSRILDAVEGCFHSLRWDCWSRSNSCALDGCSLSPSSLCWGPLGPRASCTAPPPEIGLLAADFLLPPFSLQTLSDNNFGGCHLPNTLSIFGPPIHHLIFLLHSGYQPLTPKIDYHALNTMFT